KLVRLEGARGSLQRIDAAAPDPVLSALGHAAHRFAIPVPSFADLIDGVEMDVRGTTYARFEDLLPYCRRVAGSIGRLSVAVFEASHPARAAELADDLGVAMQLTNILRDVREDRGAGRLYLPAEDLDRFGCGPDPSVAPSAALTTLVRFEAARAREWFGRGLQLLPLLDGRSRACVGAMSGIYRRVLAGVRLVPPPHRRGSEHRAAGPHGDPCAGSGRPGGIAAPDGAARAAPRGRVAGPVPVPVPRRAGRSGQSRPGAGSDEARSAA